MKKLAFIGVGVMGKSMVQNLANAGYTIHIHTRTKEKVTDILNDAIIWHDTIASCIKKADIIMTMVGFPKDVEDVYMKEQGIVNNSKKDAIFIDFTTSSPTLAKTLYECAKKHGKHSLDCPVSGGDIGAKNASLSIMVGGDEEIYLQVLPILEIVGKTIHYTGPAGFGQHTKMTNQIALAGAISGVCEAITYANAVGLDVQSMLRCISQGAAGSWQMEHMAPKMLDKQFDPGFYIKHYIKDMKIARQQVQEKNINLKILEDVLSMYQTLEENGLGDLGTQALIKYYE
jgi:3-hydroxyisobutyrate dehydrogenase/2-hydroxy-3-oxopropionate reductase